MRRQLRNASVAFLLVACSVPSARAGAPAGPICGDVNTSGSLTTTDALAVLRASVGQPVKLECPVLAAPLQTGQNSCYDIDGGDIPCAGTGEDGELSKGIPRDFTSNADGTVTDLASGLMWEKLSDDGSIHDKDSFYDWSDALFTKIAALNSDNFAGHNDWRLPNQFELYTLVRLGTGSSPTVYVPFDFDCTPGCTVLTCSCTPAVTPMYWSSTTYLNGTNGSGAWATSFDGGFTAAVDKAFSLYVRAVRTIP